MSLAQEDRANGWQKDYIRVNTTVAALLVQAREKDARIAELEEQLAAYHRVLAPLQRRQQAAAERDVPIARELLRRADLTDYQRAIAYLRWQQPGWSWAQIGAELGTTKDRAGITFLRMAQRAGLRDG